MGKLDSKLERFIADLPAKIKTADVNSEKSEVLEKERAIIHYISTPNPDWIKDKVNQFHWDSERFDRYQTVFFNHNYNLPIGSNMWHKADENGRLAKTFFSKTPFPDDIYTLHKENVIRTWSIGFLPMKGSVKYDADTDETDFDGLHLLEYSSAPLAMNPEALDVAKGMVKTFYAKNLIDKNIVDNAVVDTIEKMQKEFTDLQAKNVELQSLIEAKSGTENLTQLENKITELQNLFETELKKVQEQIKVEVKEEIKPEVKLENDKSILEVIAKVMPEAIDRAFRQIQGKE